MINRDLDQPMDSNSSETVPLLSGQTRAGVSASAENLSQITAKDPVDGAAVHKGDADASNGEAFDNVPQEKRKLGLFTATFLIFNRVIGTGIYATPSLILRSSGSVGMALVMWALGALVASAGTTVYIELGTGLPRNGGEKNYLEFIYRRPKYLVTCAYATCVVFAEYLLHALSLPTTRINTRLIGVLALTFVFLLHSTKLSWGLRLQNALGLFKLVLLLSVALSGLLSLASFPGFKLDDAHKAHNFDRGRFWEGTHLQPNALVTALYSVIWSFSGYSNANYALSEVRDPVRTIRRAAPLAMLSVVVVYMFVNLAYYAVVPKEDILNGGRIVAALFFRNLFGPATERALSVFIALSTMGNILAGVFSIGRVVQELGREGILPYSSFFASNKPFNAPLAGLGWQWLFSSLVVIAPPPGDAYTFTLSLASYPLALINGLITIGLLFLHTRAARQWNWSPPFRAWTPVVVFFLISNIFLVVVPLIPPASGFSPYDTLPYWSHVVVALVVMSLGGVYWYVWCVWLPRRGGYVLVRKLVLQEDGVSRSVFTKVPIHAQ